jgi:hypothetical protein
MRNGRGVFVLAAVCAVVGACAPQEIPFDRSTAAEVKTIGLLTPKLPDRPVVVLATTVGQSLGLVGALVDAGMRKSREDTFKDMIDAQHFVPERRSLPRT